MFKPSFGADQYYLTLPQDHVLTLMKFRTTNNNLPVNKQRYDDIPRRDRLCEKCDLHDIGDEFHYLFICPFFNDDRKQFVPRYFYAHPNTYRFHALFSSKNRKLLIRLKNFVIKIVKSFQ